MIYARAPGRFIALILTAIVPMTVLQYVVTLREQPQIDATIAWMQLPQRVQAAHLPAILNAPGVVLLALASLVVGYLILAFGIAAAGAGVAAQIQNQSVSYAACMMSALRRWRAIAGVVVVLLLLGLVAAAALTGVILVPLTALVALAPTAAIAVLSFGLIVMFAAYGVLGTMLFVIGAGAIYAATLEDCSAPEAVSRTLRRMCSRREIWRALVCSSVVSAIVIAVTACADVAGFALLQHHTALYFSADALARTVVIPFAAIAFAIYYFDVRVRQEGFDLQMLVDRLTAGTAAGVHYAPTRYLSGEERALVAAFIERRETLDLPHRRDLAARIVAPVRARVPEDLALMDDEGLLERL